MFDRKQYINAMQIRLSGLREGLKRVEARTETSLLPENERRVLAREIEAFRESADQLDGRLEAFRDSDADTWEDFKSAIEEEGESLERSFGKMLSRFRSG
jgi:hypothetical protein